MITNLKHTQSELHEGAPAHDPPATTTNRPIFCPSVLPLSKHPLKNQSSCDVFSLVNTCGGTAVPVIPPPPVKSLHINNRTNSTSTNQSTTNTNPMKVATVTRPSPPNDLPITSIPSLLTSNSRISPSRPQPRTNPYFSSPKSPKSEFGPFKSHMAAQPNVVTKPPIAQNTAKVPPPLPKNSPLRPFHSTLNLSQYKQPQSSSYNEPLQNTFLETLPDTASSQVTVKNKSRSRSPPVFLHNTLPRLLSKSMSHHHLPSFSSMPEHSTSNPFLPTSSQASSNPPVLPPVSPQNPFLPTKNLLPPPRRTSNPFRVPISTLPPEDPSDTSRELGTQLFTELLTDYLNHTASPVSCVNPCVTNPNISDPLANPPTTTLPPMNRKPSAGLVTAAAAPVVKDQPPAVSGSDRYSALKELDDLFKSTTIASKLTNLGLSYTLYDV